MPGAKCPSCSEFQFHKSSGMKSGYEGRFPSETSLL